MGKKKNSAQMALNVFGFMFLILGLGLDNGAGLALIGLAIAMFVSALVMAAIGTQNGGADNG